MHVMCKDTVAALMLSYGCSPLHTMSPRYANQCSTHFRCSNNMHYATVCTISVLECHGTTVLGNCSPISPQQGACNHRNKRQHINVQHALCSRVSRALAEGTPVQYTNSSRTAAKHPLDRWEPQELPAGALGLYGDIKQRGIIRVSHIDHISQPSTPTRVHSSSSSCTLH
jgi:hypothetical protein